MLELTKSFFGDRDGDGAVTVDWVVLSVTTVAMAIGVLRVASVGLSDVSTDVSHQMVDPPISDQFGGAVPPIGNAAIPFANSRPYQNSLDLASNSAVEASNGTVEVLSNEAIIDGTNINTEIFNTHEVTGEGTGEPGEPGELMRNSTVISGPPISENATIVSGGVYTTSGSLGIDRLVVDYSAGIGTTIGTSITSFIEADLGSVVITGDGLKQFAILAGTGGNILTTAGGDDSIIPNGLGANINTGLAGYETIVTGDDADTITVTSGNYIIMAGDGANTITATSGQNIIFAGNDADTITVTDGGNYIDGGNGANTFTSGAGNDTIVSGINTDTISTGGGDDLILISGGADVIAAGIGSDTLIVDYSAATAAVISSVLAGSFTSGYAGSLAGLGTATYAGIETFDIKSGIGNDLIATGDGNDTIDTGTGSDTVNSGSGNDYIYGNAGDVINGGFGFDTLNLGLELNLLNHTIVYDVNSAFNGIVTFLDTGGVLTFMNIESIVYELALSPTVTILVPNLDFQYK